MKQSKLEKIAKILDLRVAEHKVKDQEEGVQSSRYELILYALEEAEANDGVILGIEQMGEGKQYCPMCGQGLGYKSSVSKGVALTLRAFAQAVYEKGHNVINMRKEMVERGKITMTQYGNRTHLARLGLIANMNEEVGNFHITTKGINFLNGEPIPKWVKVKKSTKHKHSNTVDHSEEMITYKEAVKDKEYWQVPDFTIREGRVIRPPA